MNQSATVSPDVQPFLFQDVFREGRSCDVRCTGPIFRWRRAAPGGDRQEAEALRAAGGGLSRHAATRQGGPLSAGDFRQRILGLAAGYEDGNDAGRLSREPLLGFLCGKNDEECLASSSTLCRTEIPSNATTCFAWGRR